MKTTFYLIRHGETAWNAEGRLQGHTDIAIGDTGREQAEAVAQELHSKHIDAIYSSPLSRAMETAQVIGKKLDLPVHSIDTLKERHLGKLEGVTKEEMRAIYPDWERMSEEERFKDDREGTESGENTAQRILETLKLLAEKHPDQTIACVSHGGNIRFTLVKLKYGTLNTIKGIKNCGFAVITYEEGRFDVTCVEGIKTQL